MRRRLLSEKETADAERRIALTIRHKAFRDACVETVRDIERAMSVGSWTPAAILEALRSALAKEPRE